MKRGLLILLVLLLGIQMMAVAAVDDDIPLIFRDNRFYNESLRLSNLARLAFDAGEYDASTRYSEEAIRYAELSDEFVRLRLKVWETDKALTAAGRRMDYATSVNAATRYPTQYTQARTAYNDARSFRAAQSWDEAIESAHRVLEILAFLGDEEYVDSGEGGVYSLPAQYTVRTWSSVRDCLWNIAGRPWAYNDPFKWKLLYEANKSKLPQANNPDLIHPGMVIDIPSIKGEVRQGMWDAGRSYTPFK